MADEVSFNDLPMGHQHLVTLLIDLKVTSIVVDGPNNVFIAYGDDCPPITVVETQQRQPQPKRTRKRT